MAWTTPRTFVTGEVETASIFNTHLRDNLTALQPQANAVVTLESTASTTYTNLTTVGPSVTLTTGTSVLVDVCCGMFNAGASDGGAMSYAVTGATTLAASDGNALESVLGGGSQLMQASFTYLQTGLTAGSNTFTAKYHAINGGTANFTNRLIIVTACF